MEFTVLKYISEKNAIKFNPMKYGKNKLSWFCTGLMFGSVAFLSYAYIENSWFLTFIGWLSAWFSGQLWVIVSNWDKFENLN